MIDTTTVTAYTKLKRGDLVSLTDEQTITDLIKEKGAKAIKGRDLIIEVWYDKDSKTYAIADMGGRGDSESLDMDELKDYDENADEEQ